MNFFSPLHLPEMRQREPATSTEWSSRRLQDNAKSGHSTRSRDAIDILIYAADCLARRSEFIDRRNSESSFEGSENPGSSTHSTTDPDSDLEPVTDLDTDLDPGSPPESDVDMADSYDADSEEESEDESSSEEELSS